MMKKNNRAITVFFAALLVASLVGCSNNTKDAMAPVAEENATVAPTATEESTKEVDPNATYVEANGLEYEESSKVFTNGVLYVGEDIETLQVIDVNFEITNVVIEGPEDAEDGTKIVTIEQMAEGYIWTDGNIFATNLNVPVARLADAYSGVMIAVGDEDAVETEIEWKDNTYTVSAVETTSWEDGNWDTDWVEDPNGGERLSSTLYVKTVISIDEDYDGLVLVLTPIVDVNGSVDGDFIMDGWINDSYLFNVNDMSANFVADAEEVEETETETDEAEVAESAEETVKDETNTKPAETTATTAPKEEHKHSYASTDSPGTCTVAGIRTYTCTTCGYSYTENLGYGAHDFSIPVYQTVHHDAQYDVIKRELPSQKVIICRCGAEFTTNEGYDNHVISQIEAEGPFTACGSSYDIEDRPGGVTYDYVETSPAYDSEEIVAYKCSICGQQR